MPLVGFLIHGQEVGFTDAMTMALRGEMTMGLPVIAAIVNGVQTKDRPSLERGISASQFQGCPRKIILDAQVDYYDDPEHQYWMVRGTQVHRTIEEGLEAMPTDLRLCFRAEERLHTEIEVSWDDKNYAIGVHGQFDLVYLPPFDAKARGLPEYPILYDHKTQKALPKEPKADHVLQTSIYCWLMMKAGWAEYPETVAINYMDNGGVKEFRFETMDHRRVEDYLYLRLTSVMPWFVEGRLPDRATGAAQWQCGNSRSGTSYCAHSKTCWPEGFDAGSKDGWDGINLKGE